MTSYARLSDDHSDRMMISGRMSEGLQDPALADWEEDQKLAEELQLLALAEEDPFLAGGFGDGQEAMEEKERMEQDPAQGWRCSGCTSMNPWVHRRCPVCMQPRPAHLVPPRQQQELAVRSEFALVHAYQEQRNASLRGLQRNNIILGAPGSFEISVLSPSQRLQFGPKYREDPLLLSQVCWWHRYGRVPPVSAASVFGCVWTCLSVCRWKASDGFAYRWWVFMRIPTR